MTSTPRFKVPESTMTIDHVLGRTSDEELIYSSPTPVAEVKDLTEHCKQMLTSQHRG